MAIRVLVCDDHPQIRAGIRALLQHEPDIEIVAEAESADELIEVLPDTQPDVVVLDITMPGRSGLEVLKDLLELSPATAVLIFSLHAAPDYMRRAFAEGARGYLIKGSHVHELGLAIREVLAGRRYIDPQLRIQLASSNDTSR
jgi:DNA-binding NarL/FixJ family response regulator